MRDAVSAQQVQGRGRGGGQDGRPSVLCLDVGEELLTELETSELGRPLALGAVVVGDLIHSVNAGSFLFLSFPLLLSLFLSLSRNFFH